MDNQETSGLDAQADEVQHLNNPVTVAVGHTEKVYLAAVQGYRQEDNKFIFTDGHANVEVILYSDEIIRIRLAPHGTFLPDFSYAVTQPAQKVSVFGIKDLPQYYEVYTSSLTCRIEKDNFHISFVDHISNQVMVEDDLPMHWEENHDYGGFYVYNSKRCNTEENFFGLGDKTGNFNLRGRRFVNWNTDAYSFGWDQDPIYRTIPFYVGIHHSQAYGIFLDNTFKTYFDFAEQDSEKASFWADGGEMRYYYIHGPHMMDVLRRYHDLTGTHPMPPKWALGFHQCRWSYYPEAKVREIADTFRAKSIPCDAIYLDIDYMEGYRCFTWNKQYFPNPKKMIKDLATAGFKTIVMIDPGIKVDENYWVFKEGKEKAYFCRRSDDYSMEGPVWPGRCQFPDFTDPQVRNWWGGLYKEMLNLGVAGFWNDMNEPAVFGTGTFPNDVRHYYEGYYGSHRKAHNIYGMQMVRATYEGLQKLMPNKRPFTITRAGYSGVQRYASMWTGDNVATWEHLKIANIQCQRLAISGVSFIGTDIGGFSGEPDGELFTRWIQLGVFSPFMRCHSAGDTKEREPWSFGDMYENINRKFIELRYELMPYFYSVFFENHRYGYPMLRPLVLMEQDIIDNHFRQDEFAFGDKLLVCPVLEQGAASRKVYLPEGQWFNYWDHQLYAGKQEIELATPLETMPIFVKAGSVIPKYPVMQYTDEFPLEALKLDIYHSNSTVKSFLYEDQGEGMAFTEGVYVEKGFTVHGDAQHLIIEQQQTGNYRPVYEQYECKLIGLPFQPGKILIDDKQIDFKIDGALVYFNCAAHTHQIQIFSI